MNSKFHKMEQNLLEDTIRSKIESQLRYLYEVKNKYSFLDRRHVLRRFTNVLYDIKKKRIDHRRAIQEVAQIFDYDADMIRGFNALLPFGMTINVEPYSSSGEIQIVARKRIRLQWVVLNGTLKEIIDSSEDFVYDVHRHFGTAGLDFQRFIDILHLYRRQKYDVDESKTADIYLRMAVNQLLHGDVYLLGLFNNLRILDYLSVISFHIKFMPELQGDYDSPRTKFFMRVYRKLQELMKDEPENWIEFREVMKRNAIREWSEDKSADLGEVRVALSKVLEGHDEWREILKRLKYED